MQHTLSVEEQRARALEDVGCALQEGRVVRATASSSAQPDDWADEYLGVVTFVGASGRVLAGHNTVLVGAHGGARVQRFSWTPLDYAYLRFDIDDGRRVTV